MLYSYCHGIPSPLRSPQNTLVAAGLVAILCHIFHLHVPTLTGLLRLMEGRNMIISLRVSYKNKQKWPIRKPVLLLLIRGGEDSSAYRKGQLHWRVGPHRRLPYWYTKIAWNDKYCFATTLSLATYKSYPLCLRGKRSFHSGTQSATCWKLRKGLNFGRLVFCTVINVKLYCHPQICQCCPELGCM